MTCRISTRKRQRAVWRRTNLHLYAKQHYQKQIAEALASAIVLLGEGL